MTYLLGSFGSFEEVDDGASVQALWERGARQEWADALQAALPVQGWCLAFPRPARSGQAAGDEGHRGSAVCQRLVDEPHRQVAGCLDTPEPRPACAPRRRLRAA